MKLGWRPSLGGAEIRKIFLIQILLVLVHTPLLQSIESSIKIDLGGGRGGGGAEDGDAAPWSTGYVWPELWCTAAVSQTRAGHHWSDLTVWRVYHSLHRSRYAKTSIDY